jgi:hypothetical protein
MESAALVVQIKRAMMMVGVGFRDGRFDMRVTMGTDQYGLIHIQRGRRSKETPPPPAQPRRVQGARKA